MKATISGVVMEVRERTSNNKKVKVASIFQEGETELLQVKDIPANLAAGEIVDLQVSILAWKDNNGVAKIACRYLGE